MSRNIAAGRAVHPLIAGSAAIITMQRVGPGGCAILAEAGPPDPINRWTEVRVFASTEVDAPAAAPMRPPVPTAKVAERDGAPWL